MMRSETLQKVQQTVFEATGEWPTEEARIRLLVTDSLELASLMQALEDALGKDIPDEEAQSLFTVSDIVRYAETH